MENSIKIAPGGTEASEGDVFVTTNYPNAIIPQNAYDSNVSTDKKDIDLKSIIESETGVTFKNNKCKCMFHDDKTPSFTIYLKDGEQKYKCHGCNAGGDVIDFIEKYKTINFQEALEYLGLKTSDNFIAARTEKQLIIEATKKDHGNIIDTYRFTDLDGNTLYYKVKYKDKTGKKQIRYYSIDSKGKAINKRLHETEVPYNLHNLTHAKTIYITEGEKDSDTLINLGYIATSLKGVKELPEGIFNNKPVVFIGDTGEAGKKYANDIFKLLDGIVNSFNYVELTGIEALGDNKDVTDWLEAGNTKEDLQIDMRNSWNWTQCRYWRDFIFKLENGNPEKPIIKPLKTWRNLEMLLNRENITIAFNEISKEIEASGRITSTREELLEDIKHLALTNGLNINVDETIRYINYIGLKNKQNSFIKTLEKHRNSNYAIIDEVYNCLDINHDLINDEHAEQDFKMYFTKWCINVIRQAHNDGKYDSQGVLVLQGKQGTFKSTFFKLLFGNNDWFLGDRDFNPDNKDHVKINTKYICVEWGELDSTLKSDQAKLKQHISAPFDEYRQPYARLEVKNPRITTYCATVNQIDFLKDPTGSRRWWIIPVNKCNTEKMKSINMLEFWGAIYDLWIKEQDSYFMTREEQNRCEKRNMSFNAKTDISITLDECIEWEHPIYNIYNKTEVCELLGLTGKGDKVALSRELERRGYIYQTHRDIADKIKKGYKLPTITPSANTLNILEKQSKYRR